MIKKILLNVAAVAIATFTMSGCSALQETMASQMEVPTLENQANRVAIGMTIVRENNILQNKMLISSDAAWPSLVTADINSSQKQLISNLLMSDPYYATAHYTKGIQRKMLGSSASMSMLGDYADLTSAVLDQAVSPLTYRAMNKIIVFYGEKKSNWPEIFNFNTSIDNMLNFSKGTMKDIESPKGDIYDNIHKAVIALSPVNLQKDLEIAQMESEDASFAAVSIEGEKAEIETQLESNKNSDGKTLSKNEKFQLKLDLKLKEQEFKEAESIAKEREAIYFELLDQVVVALESDVNTDDKEYVKLAKNINIVANEIQASATEAYTAFGMALTNIISSKILLKLPTELKSLAIGKVYVPANLQSKYDKRVLRIVKNSLEILPNIAMGTYYAHKQSTIADKYEEITSKILEIYNTKLEQEKAAAVAQKES